MNTTAVAGTYTGSVQPSWTTDNQTDEPSVMGAVMSRPAGDADSGYTAWSDYVSENPSSTEAAWLAPGFSARWPFLFLILIMLLALLGNVFVVVAVCAHDKLRTTFYYLLASLAVCDLINTLFVMPFSLTRTMLGELPPGWCIALMCLDYMLTAATFTHMWLAVCNVHAAVLQPLKYQLRQAWAYASLNVLVAWFFAILLAVPPLVVLVYHRTEVAATCALHKTTHTLMSSISPFYAPLLILIILHAWVSTIIRNQTTMAKFLSVENGSIYSTSNGDVTFDNMELKYESMDVGGGGGQTSVRPPPKPIMRMNSNESCNSISDAEDDDSSVHDFPTADAHAASEAEDPPIGVAVSGENADVANMKRGSIQTLDSMSDINSLSDLDLRYAISKNINKVGLNTSISNCSTLTGTSFLDNKPSSECMEMARLTVGTTPDDKYEDQSENTDNQSEKSEKPNANVDGDKTERDEVTAEKENCPDDAGNKEREVAADREECIATIEDIHVDTQDKQPEEDTLSSNTVSTIPDNQQGLCDDEEGSSPRGMGPKHQSKEALNEPLEVEAGYAPDIAIDTEELIGSLERVKQKRESMEEDNPAYLDTEGEEMPLANAIRVNKPSPSISHEGSTKSNSSGSDEGGTRKSGGKKKRKTSAKKSRSREGSLTKEEKEKKNRLCLAHDIVTVVDTTSDRNHLSYPPTRQPSRMSTVSYGSAPGPDGQRRSILRRDGSCRNSNIRKSVKFASEKNTEHPIPREMKKRGEPKRISGRRKTPRKQRRRPASQTKTTNGSVRSTSSNGSVSSESSNSGTRTVQRQTSVSSANGVVQSAVPGRPKPALTRQNTVQEGPGGAITYPEGVLPELEEMDYMTKAHHTQGMRITLRIKRQKAVLVNVAIIFAVYMVMSLPNVLLSTLAALCPACRQLLGAPATAVVLLATEWVRLATSAAMPILYLCISSDFRSAMTKFCLRKPIARTNNALEHVKY